MSNYCFAKNIVLAHTAIVYVVFQIPSYKQDLVSKISIKHFYVKRNKHLHIEIPNMFFNHSKHLLVVLIVPYVEYTLVDIFKTIKK